MRKILTEIVSFILSIVIVFILVPDTYFYIKNKDLFNKYNNQDIVIIYDTKKAEDQHGQLMEKVFHESYAYFTNGKKIKNYEFIDYKTIDTDEFVYIIEKLSEENRVYISMSFSFNDQFHRDFFINKARQNEDNSNIHFFVATGNNEYTDKDYTEFWNKLSSMKEIKTRVADVPSFFLNNLEAFMLYYYLHSHSLYEKVQSMVFNDIDKKDQSLVLNSVYSFLSSSQLQNIKNIDVISGYDVYDIFHPNKKEIRAHYGVAVALERMKEIKPRKSILDCRIKGLENNKIRDLSIYYHKYKNGLMKAEIGTSVSAPVYMARVLSKR